MVAHFEIFDSTTPEAATKLKSSVLPCCAQKDPQHDAAGLESGNEERAEQMSAMDDPHQVAASMVKPDLLYNTLLPCLLSS